ncbi:MAG: hypothetical protein AAFR96_11485 [Planctomycetota bacterium]
MKPLLCVIALSMLTGCVYNKAPIHLYMRDNEMHSAVNEYFAPDVPPVTVYRTLDIMDIDYRTFPALDDAKAIGEIEADIWKAGPRLVWSCCPGVMNFLFVDDELTKITFRHPLPDDTGLLAPAQTIELEEPLAIGESGGGDAP